MATRESPTPRVGGPADTRPGAEGYPQVQGRADAGVDAEARAPRAGETIADPGPLGLAGFAATTFVLSVFNAGLVDDTKLEAVVLPLALFYGGLAQLLAGMWEFKKGNTFGTTAFGSYGAFWLAYAAYVKFVVPSLPTATEHTATGLFLLVWAVFTTYMFVAATRVSGAIALVFLTLAATFIVLTIAELGDYGASSAITKTGGWIGLVTAVCAWYASFATVTNDTWKRTLLPTMPAARR